LLIGPAVEVMTTPAAGQVAAQPLALRVSTCCVANEPIHRDEAFA